MNSKKNTEIMSQDSEKRFHSIMGKLFQPPQSAPSSSSCSGVELKTGTKRQNPEYALALVEPRTVGNSAEGYPHSAESSQAPLCRPWDRGDLMRRLATFKSMTWFAKPKIVSAINCARRGWINVDTDTIACESCGARLLFSTPSSWSRQQVEKAARVFSLKLDNGHKLVCPWIDNACDETLAQFPPTPPPVLVDKFRERSSALLQLLVLPVISSSAIEYMKSPLLDEFLQQSSSNESRDVSQIVSLCEDDAAKLYYQAQKLISLCGWEPRSLHYVVECEDGGKQLVKNANGQSPGVNANSATSHEMLEATEISQAHKSIVLDCKLCGASVGLWAFSVVPRPLEFLRLVGYTTIIDENNSVIHGSGIENQHRNSEVVANSISNGAALQSSPNLGLTIAGGPPPTKQSFKATISLPLIGRNLVAKFAFDNEFGDSMFENQDEHQSALVNDGVSDKNDTRGEEEDANHKTGEEKTVTGQDTSSEAGTHCSITQVSKESAQIVNSNQSQSDMLVETGTNSELNNPAVDSLVAGDASIRTPDANFTIRTREHGKNGEVPMITFENANMARTAGKDKRKSPEDETIKFDPIRQHRHFCPWIVSTDGRSPGWQQTLSALHRQRDRSHPSPSNSLPSASIIKVDDPVTSVRRLFMTPVTKRMKKTHESS